MFMTEFVARPSRARIALLILGSVAFVAIGLWMIGTFGPPPESHRYSPEMTTFFGWAAILFFGLCAIVLCRMLFDTEAQVRINASGLYWKRWSRETIPWSEITQVGVWEFKRQKSIILNLRDPGRFRSSTLMGKLASANKAMTGGDIAVTLAGTDGRFDDAMAAIERFWKPS
jgi:hypothetical protein